MAKKNRDARNRKIIKWIWRSLGLFFIAVLAVFFLIYNGIIGYMPPVAELRNPTDNFASTMYTADGVEMGKIFQSKGNRFYVEFDQISPYLKDAGHRCHRDRSLGDQAHHHGQGIGRWWQYHHPAARQAALHALVEQHL